MKFNAISISIFIFLSLLLLFLSVSLFANQVDKSRLETVVTTIDGVVYVYEISASALKDIPILMLGEFKRYKTEEVIEVGLKTKRSLCYIPEEMRGYAKQKLEYNVPVLMRREERAEYGTAWDLVGIGVKLKAGEVYKDGVVVMASPLRIRELMKGVLKTEVSQVSEVTPVSSKDVVVEIRNLPPSAVISTDKTSGNTRLTVSFDGSGSSDPDGTIISYSWDFGDGNAGSGKQVSHTYNSGGSFTVTLTVTDNDNMTGSSTVTIDVTGEGYYYVDPNNGDDSWDGSEGAPWKTIHHALATYNSSVSNIIYLKSGTYSSNTNGEQFDESPLYLKEGVTLQGKSGTASDVIIDAEYKTNSIIAEGLNYVKIANLTVTHGNGVKEFDIEEFSLYGGGIVLFNSGGDVVNCIVKDNNSDLELSIGGGIAITIISGNKNVSINGCTIQNNIVGNYGGGILGAALYDGAVLNVNIIDCNIVDNSGRTAHGGLAFAAHLDGSIAFSMNNCIISGNTAPETGGLVASGSGAKTLSGTIQNCEIYNNSANESIGGVRITNFSNVTISGCKIYNNASDSTGGLSLENSSDITIERCKIYKNTAKLIGAININNSEVTITNTLIYDNSASEQVTGGIFLSGAEPSLKMVNCTIADNSLSGETNGALHIHNDVTTTSVIKNCIFSGNSVGGVSVANLGGTDPVLKNNFFNNNTNFHYNGPSGVTNIAANIDGLNPDFTGNRGDTDPQFKTGTYYPSNTSPVYPGNPQGFIDGGISDSDTPTVDLLSNTRPNPDTNLPDIGCYEYYLATYLQDPTITGRVYNAVTGENISSPVIGMYRNKTNSATSTTTSNPYSFVVDPGSYYFTVNKDGYGFPSQLESSDSLGSHGEVFQVTGDMGIDIPVDPSDMLKITKTCNKKRVVIGDIVTYNIKVENKYWYRAVPNVILTDEVVNGFKYVDKSAISYQPSAVSKNKITFNLGTVKANSTTNISYQVRVGSGMVPGSYKSTGVCNKQTTNDICSNYSGIEIDVVEDSLFTKGTIIGKVFFDQNANGVQDRKKPETSNQKPEFIEVGIAGVRIATEYGVVVETDKDGKYHIADVPVGRHLLKIMPDSIPEFLTKLGGIEYTTDNPYLVKITEGLLGKVNFGISPVTSLQSPVSGKNQFFIVALGEGELRNISTSGNIEMVDEKDDKFEKGLKVDGRLAFYLKGKVLGKYLITASLDTDRRPYGRGDTQKLFTNLDPDKYYPVYGDASQIDYSAVDTQDIVYVLIEWDESYAKWGSFHTGIPLYERTLSGGKIEYRSIKKTKFGEPFTEVDLFYANARQKANHDEFVGTGGSLYYLRQRDVVEGSEKVYIEIRDRLTKVPVTRIPLQEERDYEIDYDTGRVLLRRPLNMANWGYRSSIISNDILEGERAYLIIDYEYYTREHFSKQAMGGRAKQSIGNHVSVEGMYIEEEKIENHPYQLYRGSSTFRLNENTYVTGGYTHTKQTQLSSGTSIDGGLSYVQLGEDFSNDESGSSVDIKGETRLFNNTDILLSYTRQDPYYSTTDSLSTAGSQKYIGKVITQLTNTLYCGVQHITQRLLAGTIGSKTIGTTDTHITTGIIDWVPSKWDIRLEYQHQEVTSVLDGFTYMGFIPYHNNDFIAGRIGYTINERLHPYIRGQGTVQGRTDNQGTIGTDIKVFSDTYINVAETVGNLGDSTLLGITSQLREDTDVFANIEVGNNMNLGKFTRTSYGQTTQLTKDSKVYASQDYSSYQERLIRGNILGYDKKLNDNLLFGLTYERSNIEDYAKTDTNSFINRDSGSITVEYLDVDTLRVFTKLECRNDRKENNTTRQWVTENEGEWYITKDLAILGRANWSLTDNRTDDMTEARFHEMGAGLAYRPVNWDKLNLLAKYSYITDLPPDIQEDFIEYTESCKHVYALEGAYDICRYLQLVGKFAMRDMSEKVGPRDWTDSQTYLYIARLNFHVTNKWDIAGEYRTLANRQIEDKKSGWLLEVDRELFKYARLGVGYNFTDYDDDLSNDDNYDAKGWFVRVNGKY